MPVSKRLSTPTRPTVRSRRAARLAPTRRNSSTRYHQLVDPLVAKPGLTSDPRGLSYQDAITGTVNALYSQRYWRYLTSGLLGLQRGTDAVDLLLLADDYQNRDEAGHYSNQQDASVAIRCVDSPFPTDPAVWADADRQIREAAPFLAYGTFTGFAPRDVCSTWPVPPTSSPHPASSPGPGKVVVVSTTRDPATPIRRESTWPARWARRSSPSTAPSTRWCSTATPAWTPRWRTS